jgi:hypothetical protein
VRTTEQEHGKPDVQITIPRHFFGIIKA